MIGPQVRSHPRVNVFTPQGRWRATIRRSGRGTANVLGAKRCLLPSPSQPLRHTLERIRTGGGVGSSVNAARAVGRDRIARTHLRRPIRMIEIMKCARIDHNSNSCAAAFGASDHVLAILWRRYVIGGADQDQRWDAGAPGGRVKTVATWIERHRGSEVGF